VSIVGVAITAGGGSTSAAAQSAKLSVRVEVMIAG